jgi:hypothetical protein
MGKEKLKSLVRETTQYNSRIKEIRIIQRKVG